MTTATQTLSARDRLLATLTLEEERAAARLETFAASIAEGRHPRWSDFDDAMIATGTLSAAAYVRPIAENSDSFDLAVSAIVTAALGNVPSISGSTSPSSNVIGAARLDALARYARVAGSY